MGFEVLSKKGILNNPGSLFGVVDKKSFLLFFATQNSSRTHLSPKKFIGFYFAILMILSGCQEGRKIQEPVYGKSPLSGTQAIYRFGIHPLHNPIKLMDRYQPLMDYLSRNIQGVQFVLETSRDYSDFEEKYKDRKPEFILPNPWQTLGAIQSGYEVIAMAGDPEDFKGLFIVRKDSEIKVPTDLKGKKVSYPSPTALAACIIPQYFLHTHGIDVNKDITNLYVGSQESFIMNVYMKTTAAGATWPQPWRDFQETHPKEASELMTIWELESLINNSVMVREDVPDSLRNQVKKILFELDQTAEGERILKNMETDFFKSATNEDYAVIKAYTDRFEKEVRKIEHRK